FPCLTQRGGRVVAARSRGGEPSDRERVLETLGRCSAGRGLPLRGYRHGRLGLGQADPRADARDPRPGRRAGPARLRAEARLPDPEGALRDREGRSSRGNRWLPGVPAPDPRLPGRRTPTTRGATHARYLASRLVFKEMKRFAID